MESYCLYAADENFWSCLHLAVENHYSPFADEVDSGRAYECQVTYNNLVIVMQCQHPNLGVDIKCYLELL